MTSNWTDDWHCEDLETKTTWLFTWLSITVQSARPITSRVQTYDEDRIIGQDLETGWRPLAVHLDIGVEDQPSL